MPSPHGSFIWYELLADDVTAAQTFYEKVIGWTGARFGDGAGGGDDIPDYRIFRAPDGVAAGLMALPPEARSRGLRAGWYGYIGVDDVDAATAAITAAGGSIWMQPTDFAGVGRIALVTDPQDIPFYVMRGADPGSSGAFSSTALGHCGWNELKTTDAPAAIAFYTGLFGWSQEGAMPMGAFGDYLFLQHAGAPLGAAMPAFGGVPPTWAFYFRVADIDAAAGRIAAAGGTILRGPVEVPGGDHVISGADDRGVSFAVVGRRLEGRG